MWRARGTRDRLPDLVFAYPGDLDAPTGGYAYGRRIVSELRGLGWTVDLLPLGPGFPFPAADTMAGAYGALSRVGPRTLLVDGLALGALPEIGAHLAANHRLFALVHHPLALETGLDAERAASLLDSERRALSVARGIVVTSATTAASVRRLFDVTAPITIAVPGTDPAAPARGSRGDGMALLSVGTLTPRKGHDLLLTALARLRHRRWTLRIVGDATLDAACAADLRARAAVLGDRVVLTGALAPAALAAEYDCADLFVLASRYEGFGMAYAEAIAHGLPVVGTTAGAIAEAVPPGAGLLLPPDDVDALALALDGLLCDATARERLAAGARAAAPRLATWSDSAACLWRALA